MNMHDENASRAIRSTLALLLTLAASIPGGRGSGTSATRAQSLGDTYRGP